VFGFEPVADGGDDGFCALCGDFAAGDETFAEERADGWFGGDELADARLGEGRLVGFVVAVAAVAVHVDDDIAAEALAEFEGEFGDEVDFQGVVTVDVEDRGFDHFGDVSGVGGATGVGGSGGEADLVIDDDVDGAAGAVAWELGEIEGFRDHALACEGGVAVEEDGDDGFAVEAVALGALTGAGGTFDDWVDGFEVAWVRGEGDEDRAVFEFAFDLVAEVVFDVAVACDEVWDVVFVELVEDDLERFLEEVGEDGEAAAVGHAHHDFLDASGWAFFEDGVEGDHEAFTAFEGEAFLAFALGVEELFEGFCLPEPLEDIFAGFGGRVGEVDAGFDAGLEPVADFGVIDVGVFEADAVAVGFSETGDHVAELGAAALIVEHGFDFCGEVAFGEVEFGEAEFGLFVA